MWETSLVVTNASATWKQRQCGEQLGSVLKLNHQVQTPALPFCSCVTLGKSLHFFNSLVSQ